MAPRPEAIPDEEPGPGEVRLSVRAIGIDRAEKPFDIGQSKTRETSPARIEYDVVGVLPLSQIAEAHYLDSYDCVGKTVPGVVGAPG